MLVNFRSITPPSLFVKFEYQHDLFWTKHNKASILKANLWQHLQHTLTFYNLATLLCLFIYVC